MVAEDKSNPVAGRLRMFAAAIQHAVGSPMPGRIGALLVQLETIWPSLVVRNELFPPDTMANLGALSAALSPLVEAKNRLSDLTVEDSAAITQAAHLLELSLLGQRICGRHGKIRLDVLAEEFSPALSRTERY